MDSDTDSAQYWGEDDVVWDNIFCLRDEVDNNGLGDSDSENEDDNGHVLSVQEGPTELESHPTYETTRALCECWKTQNLVDRIQKGLDCLGELGLNLEIMLDGISWGDSDCIEDSKIRNACTSLLHSKELSGILCQWHRPP